MDFNAKELNDQILKAQGVDVKKEEAKMPESLFNAIQDMNDKKLTGAIDKDPNEKRWFGELKVKDNILFSIVCKCGNSYKGKIKAIHTSSNVFNISNPSCDKCGSDRSIKFFKRKIT